MMWSPEVIIFKIFYFFLGNFLNKKNEIYDILNRQEKNNVNHYETNRNTFQEKINKRANDILKTLEKNNLHA